jgi:protein-S-isoprenylcysteine O-methyltransferase Ste14
MSVQLLALGLFLWARITFGRRSYHFVADPTKGGLVLGGPYRYIRHPIYAAMRLFTLAGVARALVLELRFYWWSGVG